jgi:hypothetical protein
MCVEEKCTGNFLLFHLLFFGLLVVGFPTFQHALTIPTPQYNLGWKRFQFEAVQSSIAVFCGA